MSLLSLLINAIQINDAILIIKLIISSNFKGISSLHNLLAGLFWKISAWRKWIVVLKLEFSPGHLLQFSSGFIYKTKEHKHKFKCMFVCWNTDDGLHYWSNQRYRELVMVGNWQIVFALANVLTALVNLLLWDTNKQSAWDPRQKYLQNRFWLSDAGRAEQTSWQSPVEKQSQ